VRVSAMAATQSTWGGDAQDAVMTVMEFPAAPGGPGPRLAQTHDAFTVPHDTTRLEVHGSAGSIAVRAARTQDTPGTVHLSTAEATEEIPVDCSPDLYGIVLDNVADAARGQGQPTADGRAGLAALQVALAAQLSADEHRTISLSDLT